MRHAAFLLLLCACSSLSTEQRDELALHQRNAKHYWEGGRLDQAMGQIEKGLELAPDDYSLNVLKGVILLKTSASSQGTDHRRLDEATELLARVYGERSAGRHEPSLLFSYGLSLQKQGRRHLGEAIRLRGEATRSLEPRPLLDKAEEEQATADGQFATATEVLAVLLDRGELLRLTHYHLLLIAQDRKDDVAFDEHAKKYLEQMKKEQAVVQKQIDKTQQVGFEHERAKDLRALKNEEMEVCGLLAEHRYSHKKYQEALDMLNRVLEIDPARSVDYYNRGRVLLELQRGAEAKADFRKFLATTTLPATSDKTTFATLALDR
jgi:tetratricopeptide (TPR) repeat protein